MRQHDSGRATRCAQGAIIALALSLPPPWSAPSRADEPVAGATDKPVAAAPDASHEPVVAQRGDLKLTAADVAALLSHIDASARQRLLASPQALAGFLRQYLRDRALLARAEAAHWDQKPDVAYAAEQARTRAIIETYLQSLTQPDAAYPSEADIQTVYDANKSRLGTPRQLHLAQIFIAVPPDAPKPVETAALARITALRSLIDRQHKDFAAIARKESQDRPSADVGGDLGWVRETQLQPGLRDGVADLADGALSPPLRGPNGWHLIRVIETKPAEIPSLASLHDQIAQALRQQKQKALAQAYLEQMDKAEPVRVDEIEAGKLAPP